MKWTNTLVKYDYNPIDMNLPMLQLLEENNSRIYVTPSGRKLPSVTTVTGFDSKEGFAIWRRMNPREGIRVIDRGNKIHSMMENLLMNEEVVPADDIEIDSLFSMIKNHVCSRIGRIYALEAQMWSESIGLAGRADCICEYEGKLSIVDFKGSTREKNESGIKNYFQQATAYALMYQEIMNTKVEQIVILIASETGVLQEFKKKPIDYVDGLLTAIRAYEKHNQLKPTRLVAD